MGGNASGPRDHVLILDTSAWMGARARQGILLEQAKVAVVPGEAFGAPGYARLSFALGDDELVEGIGRIADLLAGTA